MECLFCDFAKSEKDCFKVWEDDLFIAFLDIHPINPGHTLIVPKKHYADAFEMDESTYSKIFEVARFLAPKMKNAFGAPRVGLAIEGFGVEHVHIHLVPVHNGNELNPERAKEALVEELQHSQAKLIAAINA